MPTFLLAAPADFSRRRALQPLIHVLVWGLFGLTFLLLHPLTGRVAVPPQCWVKQGLTLAVWVGAFCLTAGVSVPRRLVRGGPVATAAAVLLANYGLEKQLPLRELMNRAFHAPPAGRRARGPSCGPPLGGLRGAAARFASTPPVRSLRCWCWASPPASRWCSAAKTRPRAASGSNATTTAWKPRKACTRCLRVGSTWHFWTFGCRSSPAWSRPACWPSPGPPGWCSPPPPAGTPWEGYRVDALDCLVKPCNYEGFLRAAGKARAYAGRDQAAAAPAAAPPEEDSISLKVEYQLVRVLLADVLYAEGLKDHAQVHLKSAPRALLSLLSLRALEEKLPTRRFRRIHRSFIVALDKIEAVRRLTVQLGDAALPVGDQYKEAFGQFLSR